jgi:hypothetical protein
MCFPETTVRNYHYTLRNDPEERGYVPIRRESLKSSIFFFLKRLMTREQGL